MTGHIFTGFGFGPIQGGLFAKEAFESGNFARIVVAEIDSDLVDAVKANNGSYYVNVARSDGIEALKIDGVELLNPRFEQDKRIVCEVLTQSTEIVTCLPSVTFYETGGTDSIVSLIAKGLEKSKSKATIIYTAENNNHAAEILEKAVIHELTRMYTNSEKEEFVKIRGKESRVQFLNTVIGKMSRVVTDPAEITGLDLKPIAPGLDRAFLVEQFNRILVSRTRIGGFKPGIEVFIEKDDLLPFEEVKLYGHNAVHSLLGFIGALKGYTAMDELKGDYELMKVGKDAFLNECGAALIKKYAHLGDEILTEDGFKTYANDLLERMTNPYLGDTIARVVRDVPRKLEADGRIFGTMKLALEQGIEPKNMALGAMAGIAELLKNAENSNLPEDLHFSGWHTLDKVAVEALIKWLWDSQPIDRFPWIVEHVYEAKAKLERLMNK